MNNGLVESHLKHFQHIAARMQRDTMIKDGIWPASDVDEPGKSSIEDAIATAKQHANFPALANAIRGKLGFQMELSRSGMNDPRVGDGDIKKKKMTFNARINALQAVRDHAAWFEIGTFVRMKTANGFVDGAVAAVDGDGLLEVAILIPNHLPAPGEPFMTSHHVVKIRPEDCSLI